MQMRPIGRSSLSTAPLALGGNVFGWSIRDEKRAFGVLDAFVAGGGNLIDTADSYPAWVPGNYGGESETLIGKWLARSGKRDQVLIATKVGKWSAQVGLSRLNVRSALEGSLRRLGTDHVDLYFAHEDDASILMTETLGEFSRLIEEGKVRAIGASNFTADRFERALLIAEQQHLARYECLQPEYNLVARAHYEKHYEMLARRKEVGVTPYYALASGFLTGKYRHSGDAARSGARGAGAMRHLDARGRRVLAALDEVAAAHQATPAQVALAWLIARPGITAPIASATSATQAEELVGAMQLALKPGEISALDRASAA